jgi:hypothetical protein
MRREFGHSVSDYVLVKNGSPINHEYTFAKMFQKLSLDKLDNCLIGSRTCDLPTCSIVPQPLCYRAPHIYIYIYDTICVRSLFIYIHIHIIYKERDRTQIVSYTSYYEECRLLRCYAVWLL